MIESGANRNAPVLEVEHFQLTPSGDPNTFRSQCPACVEGNLCVRRNSQTMQIEELDNCLLCGQAVKYLDIEQLRQRDWANWGKEQAE